MNPLRSIGALMALAVLQGCTPTYTASRAEIRLLRDRQALRSMGTSVQYCGSKRGFDYFRGWNGNRGSLGGRVEWYKVAEAENAVSKRLPFTNDPSLWVFYAE